MPDRAMALLPDFCMPPLKKRPVWLDVYNIVLIQPTEAYMHKVIIGISAASAFMFIGTLDADAAKISGNFCWCRCASGML
jgi:hypothetical protein